MAHAQRRGSAQHARKAFLVSSHSKDRRLAVLLPSAFLTSLGIGVINLGMLFLVKGSYRANPSTVGAFAALWTIAYFAGCIVLRPLQRLIPARASMAAMNLGSAAVLAAQLIKPGLVSAFLACGAYGFLTALFWPRLMGWLSAGLEGAQLSAATNAFSFAWSAGGIISPYLAGLLAERGPFYPVYATVGIFGLTGVFIAASGRLAASPPLPVRAEVDAPDKAAADSGAVDRSSLLRYPAWIGVFLVYALIAVFLNIFPLFAKDELGLSESRIGLILLVRSLTTTAGFVLLGRSEAWHFRRSFILAPLLVFLALDLAFALLRAPIAFVILLAIAGLFQALAYNNSMFYGASGALDREKRMTIHEALLTAGQILGSVAGGLLYQAGSWSMIFIVLSGLFVVGIFVMARSLAQRS